MLLWYMLSEKNCIFIMVIVVKIVVLKIIHKICREWLNRFGFNFFPCFQIKNAGHSVPKFICFYSNSIKESILLTLNIFLAVLKSWLGTVSIHWKICFIRTDWGGWTTEILPENDRLLSLHNSAYSTRIPPAAFPRN